MSHYDHDRENMNKEFRARMLAAHTEANPNGVREDEKTNNNDPVNNPKHYTNHPSGIECKDVIEHFSYHLGCAIKYVWRCDEKGKPIEDLKNAIKSIQFEIDMRERK